MFRFSILVIIISFVFASCNEESLTIPPVSKGEHNVLIEEFTGVRCVSCPDGAAEIESLKGLYGENVVAVSIHAGFFSKKLSDSKYDFTTPAGNNILNYLGAPLGNPAAVINRKPFGTNGILVVESLGSWAGLVKKEVETPAKAFLTLENAYNASNRKLTVKVNITPTENLTAEHRISIMLTENDIVDAQIVPVKGVVKDYVHRHVLRDMLTNFDGNIINESLSKDTKLTKEFTYILPENFKAEKCEIIAFLHKSGNEREVLQATAKKLQ